MAERSVSRNLEGKTAFVTGATRGIGRAVAVALHDAGARVVGTGTGVSEDDGPLHEYVQADFSSLAGIRICADAVRRVAPDILVNNAGINKIAPFAEIALEDFLRIQQVNVTTPFVLCQAAISGMRSKAWGRIVGISSVWGKIGKAQRASYSASKFALDGMMLSLAAEHAADGILANCVAPGFTDTELTRQVLGDAGIAKILQTVPIGRLARVEEIARFVVWLASPDNTYVTGQNIAIDGGFSRV
jgi:3-oxoacyl-[acyl-carrier protein] reductase